ncbi:MAG: MFS transporter [Magnetospirillum sp.]|nr:MFS transporter [Magnetospirillum sp.]
MVTPFRLLCLSRAGICMAAMAYAGALPFLQAAWGMDGAAAGSVQAAYNFANAVALLLASWLSDRLGAKRVYLFSIWAGVAAMALFALFARSHGSALVLAVLVAASQGGAYTPALMLVAEMEPPARRGGAIGGVLAAASFGYVLSISAALGGAALLDYRWGFALCAVGPVAGAAAGSLALRRHPNTVHPRQDGAGDGLWRIMVTPVSLALLAGYTAHCWELLGTWAWAPAFLAHALAGLALGAVPTGLVVACAVHLSGMAANLMAGAASDRWGRPVVLLGIALAGALCSFALGWSAEWGPWAALMLACLASFFVLADSGVLSAAMTEAVPSRHLGTALALRSILGFSAGSLAPVVFGATLDSTGQWGWAFMTLGVGGALAAVAAAGLVRRSARA